MSEEQSRLWIMSALLVVAIYASVTFLTTLATEDWRQCFEAGGSLAHRYPVREYPWAKHFGYFLWSLASATPAVIGLAVLRSRTVALLCAILLAPSIWTVLRDFSLMIGELVSGATVTAQDGYHHCDRKGYVSADLIRIWLYFAGAIVGVAAIAVWIDRKMRSATAERSSLS